MPPFCFIKFNIANMLCIRSISIFQEQKKKIVSHSISLISENQHLFTTFSIHIIPQRDITANLKNTMWMFHVLLSFLPDQNRIEINYSFHSILYKFCFGLFYYTAISWTNEMENFLIQFDINIHNSCEREESWVKLR
jgi:hypothetical protein